MQMTITSSLQQSQLDYSQRTLTQSISVTSPQLPPPPPPPPQDRIEFSREARRHNNEGHSVDHVNKTPHGRKDNQLFDFLKTVVEQISGAQIDDMQQLTADDAATVPVAANQQSSLSAQQSTLSFESNSLSIDGSVATSDGAKLSFSLDLQVLHASVSASAFSLNSGPSGYDFSFAGSSAELTSTSFSFSLTAETPAGTPATGSGVGKFSLKDDLKEVRQTLKPLLKDFMKDAGMTSDRHSINQFLSTLA
ncbi:MAG: hypothetical protein HGB32_09110 [Geobacteraceae bacterium]|nr:hypothetical protein [Geobacteraceae bacterium]NTW80293.1 hypothetical protein [Geobacteraceae bacterium]